MKAEKRKARDLATAQRAIDAVPLRWPRFPIAHRAAHHEMRPILEHIATRLLQRGR